MASNNTSQLKDGSPTHTSKKTGRGIALDILFAHSSLLNKFIWETINDFRSDHQPTSITYADSIQKVKNKPRYKCRNIKAKWQHICQEDRRQPAKNYEKKNLNKIKKIIRKAITKTAHKMQGRRKPCRSTNAR